MVYDVVDMQQQGEIIRRSQPALDELAYREAIAYRTA